MTLRVAFDATPLLGDRTGVGVMTHEVLRRLAPDLDVVAYALTWRGRRGLAARLPDGTAVVTRPMAARPLRLCWRLTDHPRIERWTGPVDVVHGPNYVVPPSRAPQVLTVHDLTTLRFPELCTTDTLDYPTLIRRALSRGAHIHTVSQTVADEVRDHFAVGPDRVTCIPNGVGEPVDAPSGMGRRLAGAERYVLGLGTAEPRKDFPTLVAAFDLLAAGDPDLALTLVGPDGWGGGALRHAIASSPFGARISRVDRWVDDMERSALLGEAAVLAYPSIYEGFGLPPLEAMAVGTPVVATLTGAVREVVADAALLVEPRDVDALAGALERVLHDDALAADLVTKGRARARHFSWDTTATGLISLYHRLADA